MNLYFKLWLEAIEPKRPSGVRKSNIVKDKGTNVAKPSTQYQWKTKLGNNVKLHFDHEGDDTYRVVFYVNNTLHDDAPNNTDNGRDTEILPGVFWLLKDRADRLGAKRLNFRGESSDKDTKIVRGLDPEKFKPRALAELQNFEAIVMGHQVQMIPPTQRKIDLWQKLNRGDPQPTPDFRKDGWVRWIAQAKEAIVNNDSENKIVDGLLTGQGIGDFNPIGFDPTNLISALSDFFNAVKSNTESGWTRKRNRRTAIYTRLVQKHMAEDWDIEISGDWFYLTRK